jgi:hypothetical protein
MQRNEAPLDAQREHDQYDVHGHQEKSIEFFDVESEDHQLDDRQTKKAGNGEIYDRNQRIRFQLFVMIVKD